jgi:protein TonB
MISRAHPFLGRALAISVVLHVLLVAAPAWRVNAPVQSALTVSLRESPAAATPPPTLETAPPPAAPLLQPEPEPIKTVARPAGAPLLPQTARQTITLQALSGAAARDAREQLARELMYPPEAIERGQQGEALVLLFLDEAGNVVAARLEASSGHAILDEAAVRAARTLRALPASAPREALLPVRFRLR